MAVGELAIHFLGTGGGRHTMSTQRRRTAGLRLSGPAEVHIDPGPGALVHSIYAGLPPARLDGVVVTHCHPDHYTDAEALVEAMTQGASRRRGVLAAPRSVLSGSGEIDRGVSGYHQRLPRSVEPLSPGSDFKVGGVGFHATPAFHGDPDAVGLVMDAPGLGRVGYTSDTEYNPLLIDAYGGCRLLILCTMWPGDEPLEGHLNTGDAVRLIRETEPKAAVTTHYGFKMLNADPAREAERIQGETGVPVFHSVDGMRVVLGERITASGPRKGDPVRTVDA